MKPDEVQQTRGKCPHCGFELMFDERERSGIPIECSSCHKKFTIFNVKVAFAGTDNLFSIHGRINRMTYFLSCLATWGIALIALISIYMTNSRHHGLEILASLLILTCFAFYCVLTIKRLHDLNYSGWALLLIILPLANIFILLTCLLSPGTEGHNNYGSEPA